MRIWVDAKNRRPTPEPVATNDATALLVGCALWALGLVVILIASATGVDLPPAVIATAVLGLLLGSIGLLYARSRT